MAVNSRPTAHISLPIEGMNCASCVGRVEAALNKVDGVEQVVVNLATERAEIRSHNADPQPLIDAIHRAGYQVPQQVTELSIEGMNCASCVGRVERALQAVNGVTEVSVNLATERATVKGNVELQALLDAVQTSGYQASQTSNDTVQTGQNEQANARKQAEYTALRRDLSIAFVLTLPLFMLEMGGHFIPAVHHWVANTIGIQTSWLLQCALASLVLFGPGLRFFRHGLPALLRGAPDMNSLMVLGTSAAWGYSVVATFFAELLPQGTANVYFEAAAVIVTLILLGRLLEARAKGRTSQAIQRLVGLQPRTARIRRDGKVIEVAIAEVALGDVLEVRPGERLPVDGEVLEGSSYVDESMISGEPVPVAKQEGDELVAGTINQQGTLTLRATAVGGDTVLAQIIRMVEQAQSSKLPIQTLVDKVTLWFVPAVMAAAAITFAIWLLAGPDPALSFALVNAVAVLIIACPCAMGLATPTSIMVGTGRGAEMGILFRKGEALQSLKDAQVVALDKTGTLTAGQPALTDLQVASGFDQDTVLALVAAAESRSEHPIARAMVEQAEKEGLKLAAVSQFESVTGLGIRARVSEHDVHIGADRYMQQLGLEVSEFAQTAARLADEGKSPLYAAIDGKLAAVIAVADPIKEDTPAAIQALHQLGLKVAMITGDNQRTADAIARQLGIDEVVAEVLPQGKVDAVQQLKSRYGQLAFVGDGINDAPALAQAEVGIAIGTGTDIAIEAADVVLMSGSVQGVANAIALSQHTLRNIKQNLFWAFAYNTALIPVAAGALYPALGMLLSPVFAAAAMALSSVFVLTNALRLRRFKAPHPHTEAAGA
ncbi:copper-translocating P-type ATPase [Bacterioplanes sanyensis]|uniref:heavy metal translocating P-type ATPase n=1 Tax=Bacterioplanes sanyensis TaxID=1249553 RepID=UPI00167232D1|nr:heavy metal translocating P-type ATPase [Bacterioplanes sanyensis]GGY52469.1 copper-translocating P-type ATPase [Bacterioplanes sanyensis]